ncbi:MAG: hypothetical protein HWE14_02155 [Flavobacteriia bacterium]|nr:hypothetical protein [Flavobacteriia bacterium]
MISSRSLLLVFTLLIVSSCGHPYFNLVESSGFKSEAVVNSVSYLPEVDSANWTYIGSFRSDRKLEPEVLRDSIDANAIKLGANVVHLRYFRMDKGGTVLKGDLYYSPYNPEYPLDTTKTSVIFKALGYADTDAIISFPDSSLSFRVSAGKYYQMDWPKGADTLHFQLNGQPQNLIVDDKPVLLLIPTMPGASYSPQVAPVFAGGGVGVGIFFPVGNYTSTPNPKAIADPFRMIIEMSIAGRQE